MTIQPVIMSGGSGTRLWPLSRSAKPKQFLKLVSDRTLFQETVLRTVDDHGAFAPPLIIAGEHHHALVVEQLAEINIEPATIILEPIGRNTAAVAAIAAAWTAKNNPEALVFLSPADHHVEDTNTFRKSILSGARAAEDGRIVTFGIKPTHPHTGYGYINCGDIIDENTFTVAAFKEKPNANLAKTYIAAGTYFWNAGLFLYEAQAMMAELQAHAPEIAEHAVSALSNGAKQQSAILLNKDYFVKAPGISIDYAVMEKTEKAAIVAPVDVGWNDIGSWSEVRSNPGANDELQIDCHNLTIRSDGPVVSAIGVEDLIIVATPDAVLVARRDQAQEVRGLVDELKRQGREDLL